MAGFVPVPSVKPTIPTITPQIGSVDSARWRGFRQSGPILSLIECIMTDTLQLITTAKALQPFRSVSSLLNIPQRGTNLSNISINAQTYAIQLESIRMQLAFKMSDPTKI